MVSLQDRLPLPIDGADFYLGIRKTLLSELLSAGTDCGELRQKGSLLSFQKLRGILEKGIQLGLLVGQFLLQIRDPLKLTLDHRNAILQVVKVRGPSSGSFHVIPFRDYFSPFPMLTNNSILWNER